MNTPKATDVLVKLANAPITTSKPVITEAAAHLYRDLMGIVGEDEISKHPMHDDPDYYRHRNQLRAELKTALADYFDVEEGEV